MMFTCLLSAVLAAGPVNTDCPIGKEPIVAGVPTITYKGHEIGFCCPGCGSAFMAWDETRRDAWVASAMSGTAPAVAPAAAPAVPAAPTGAAAAADGPTYPYPLDTCAIAGSKLGSMGDPIVKVYDGREVRFCCVSCVPAFEADRAKGWAAVDAKIVARQRMHYPLDTCIVTGRPLGADAVDHVHQNRLVRLANPDAVAAFKAAPARHLAALDARIVRDQRAGYPMTQCPIGGALGSMGEPVDMVVENRLVRLCCASCTKGVLANPAATLAKLDAAYAAAQRDTYPRSTCIVMDGSKLGSMGDPIELVAGTRLVKFCCASCVPTFQKDPQKFLAKLPRPRG